MMSNVFLARFTYSSAGIKRQLIRIGEMETFSNRVFALSLSCSTASIYDAPREAASRAIIPEPVKISRKERPERLPRQAKTDSRILSMLGLIIPAGTAIILPRSVPPVILTAISTAPEARSVLHCSQLAHLRSVLLVHMILQFVSAFLRCLF